jgi:hypothetical protein
MASLAKDFGLNMERVIVYVDGFNLYFGLKSKGWRRYYWLDLCRLAESLLRGKQQLIGVKYFTSRVAGPPEKVKRQVTWLEAVQTLSCCQMYFGKYLSDPRTCPRCKYRYSVPTEKMTDVNIATQMLSDAHGNSFETAILLSGDSDLVGPVRAVRQGFPTKRIVVVFPPDRVSVDLRNAASASFVLGRAILAKCQLPEQIRKADGTVLYRPPSWR